MKGFDRLHIKSAVKAHNSMPLPETHLTTMEIGQVQALYHKPLLPGDKFHIKGTYFSRLAPLVKPTFGKFAFKTMAVFVPYHQVAFDADAWINGKTVFEGMVPNIRLMKLVDYISFLNDSQISTEVTATDAYDFKYVNSSGVTKYKMFTNLGRYYYKQLSCLGFAIPSNIDLQTSSTWYSKFSTKTINIMPFLCYCKAYNDYMSQSQRFNQSAMTSMLRCIKFNQDVSSVYTASTHLLSAYGLFVMLKNILVGYENDYFTTAWQNIEQPTGANENVNYLEVPVNFDTVHQNSSGVYMETNTPDFIFQRSLDILQSFYKWVKRNNYAGSRDVQQAFARYGIKTEDFDSNFAHLITTSSQSIMVGDVTATAQSTNVPLGDYAGKGILSDSKDVSYHSSDFGLLMILGWMTVAPFYSYGFERELLKTSPFDFYTPEFDGVGAQAISFGEVFSNPICEASDTTQDDSVFGFTERYNEYRFGRDQITGDFRNYRNFSDFNVWHTGRLLNDVRKNGGMVAQSTSMNTLAQTDSEYNRIFGNTSGDEDHFYMTCQFQVDAVRPLLNLNQAVGLGVGDTVVSRNGNEVN